MINFIKKIIAPRSAKEDEKRREFILNILLITAIVLFLVAIFVSIFAAIYRPSSREESSLPIVFLICILMLFLGLYSLSRKGFSRISVHIFLSLFYSLALFMSIKWGVDVNASLLIYALVIVMAGILESTKYSFITTLIIASSLMWVSYLQKAGIITTNTYWRMEPWQMSDTVMTIIILLSVSIVSWLSNREIEKSLIRARRSEASLKKERDMLEETVEKRTKELLEAETEKISQIYRFAEFGRLSSGLFHDLMNPLNAVSLRVEKARDEKNISGNLDKAKEHLDNALIAAKRMENFIIAVQKQITKEAKPSTFSLVESTRQVLEILAYKSSLAKVRIDFKFDNDIKVFGEEIKWNQVALNLITNAIDAYNDISSEIKTERNVHIALKENDDEIIFSVTDYGSGINPENIQKIFKPFFTTKHEKEIKGLGIGLSTTKNIVEKDFKGKIDVLSTKNKSTVFSVVLPKSNN